VYPGDIVGFQQRARSDYNSILGTPYRPPPFKIEVVYEDDHMAIVNKPAGIVVYRAEGGRGGGARGGHGRDTLLSALPYVLKPSKFTNDSEEVPLERPQPVHRLDRPTSGLTVVAKTKAAAVRLAQQFEFRKARKTYCAIVNGVPIAGDSEDTFSEWRTVDYDLDGKSAITSWRQIRRVQSLHGRDGQLTLVELKPKTGRYHQLRRHMVRIRFICRFILFDLASLILFVCTRLGCARVPLWATRHTTTQTNQRCAFESADCSYVQMPSKWSIHTIIHLLDGKRG
jgi:23S rRNA-/tRNA-specific pseudouridylate synthase